MEISSAQCRAARGILGWSQEQLADIAGVARATIADFEWSLRVPMRQNMVSLVCAFEAQGVVFIPDDDQGEGAGVRLKRVEVTCSDELVPVDGGWAVGLPVAYRGRRYTFVVSRELADDTERGGHFRTFEERAKAVRRNLWVFLHEVQRVLTTTPELAEGRVDIDRRNLPRGALAGF